MNNISTYPLRLPTSLKKEVAKTAKQDGTSVNQFIAIAVAEKISALKTEDFFAERAKKSNMNSLLALLSRNGGEPPQIGDECD